MINPDEDHPTDWFEPLYASATVSGDGIPWANMSTHPYLREWLEAYPLSGEGRKAIVIGCGMGDDAIELEKLGYDVIAFDVSVSAIELCKKRFPGSSVKFLAADLFNLPDEWKFGFDFVLEIYTIQALPPKYEEIAIRSICELVSLHGQILVIAQVNLSSRSFENGPPWLLSPEHRNVFKSNGMHLENHSEKPTQSGTNQVYFSLFLRRG